MAKTEYLPLPAEEKEDLLVGRRTSAAESMATDEACEGGPFKQIRPKDVPPAFFVDSEAMPVF